MRQSRLISAAATRRLVTRSEWSPNVRAILLFELDEHLMHSLSYKVGIANGGQSLPTLNGFHAAAISFSDRISRDRLEFRRELEDSRLRSRIYQYLILGLGAAATIFVSIRAIMKESTGWSGAVGSLGYRTLSGRRRSVFHEHFRRKPSNGHTRPAGAVAASTTSLAHCV